MERRRKISHALGHKILYFELEFCSDHFEKLKHILMCVMWTWVCLFQSDEGY